MADGLSDAEIEARLGAAPGDRWDELWRAVDALAAEPEKGRWEGGNDIGEPGKPVIQMPYVVYHDVVHDVTAKVSGLGASEPFDWMGWGGLQRYPNGMGLAEAPVAESIRMVTAIVRSDRFVEGALLSALEGGAFFAALDRLRSWYERR